jgi:hypothetical protein
MTKKKNISKSNCHRRAGRVTGIPLYQTPRETTWSTIPPTHKKGSINARARVPAVDLFIILLTVFMITNLHIQSLPMVEEQDVSAQYT